MSIPKKGGSHSYSAKLVKQKPIDYTNRPVIQETSCFCQNGVLAFEVISCHLNIVC